MKNKRIVVVVPLSLCLSSFSGHDSRKKAVSWLVESVPTAGSRTGNPNRTGYVRGLETCNLLVNGYIEGVSKKVEWDKYQNRRM